MDWDRIEGSGIAKDQVRKDVDVWLNGVDRL
jgi:hypothetical protein